MALIFITRSHISHHSPTILLCSNQSARYIIAKPIFHEHKKHIEIDRHIVCDKMQNGLIHLLPIYSINQLASVFTKPLLAHVFTTLYSKLGIVNIDHPASGGRSYSKMQFRKKKMKRMRTREQVLVIIKLVKN